jgi:phospholipase/carboxylesterase
VSRELPSLQGGLELAYRAGMTDGDRGGTTVVLLHGWRESGARLVPLARALAARGARACVPAAPLPEPGGGRSWWRLEDGDRPAWAWDDEPPAGYGPHKLVTAARLAVQDLLAAIRDRYAPDTVAVAGFSQGAMLALDVAVRAESNVDRVGAVSGVLLADSLPALRTPAPTRPRILLAHGRHDEDVPIAGGERASSLLERYGHAVDWRPFDGGHGIPPAIVTALADFLVDAQ